MATKIYLPTKADQEETNKKIDDLLKHIEDLQSSASILLEKQMKYLEVSYNGYFN